MAEHQLTVASAVIVPEQNVPHESSPTNAKRAGCPLVSETGKRIRVDSTTTEMAVLPITGNSNQVDRRSSGAIEERKRGRRLFGALLGTLSQSSSSTAEKRRVDIEKRQQAKLKSQSDQLDERKRQHYNALLEVRNQEQKKYEHQSLLIRHSNGLSMAHFLMTNTKPHLYYKPWELLPEENQRIALQRKEIEGRIHEEASQENVNHTLDEDVEAICDPKQASSGDGLSRLTVGDLANTTVIPDQSHSKPTDPSASAILEVVKSPSSTRDREQADDAGEVVEGDEDIAIY